MNWFERLMDHLFEYVEIRDGCGADDPNPDKQIFLKRWFIVRDPNASTPNIHLPKLNLTWKLKGHGMVMLHKFMRSDADRELHDHPWNFTSIILWRGYYEEVENIIEMVDAFGEKWLVPGCEIKDVVGLEPLDLFHQERKWPGMILRRDATHRHRVKLINEKPSWSLIFTSGKQRGWGFWREGSFIPWREFVNKKCQPSENT